jgi:hypothetical protein
MLFIGAYDKTDHEIYIALLLAEAARHSTIPTVHVALCDDEGIIPTGNVQLHTLIMCINLNDTLSYEIMNCWYDKVCKLYCYNSTFLSWKKMVIMRNWEGGYTDTGYWQDFSTVNKIIVEKNISSTWHELIS